MLYNFTDVIKKHGDNNDFVYEETLANYLVDFTGEYIFFYRDEHENTWSI